MTGRNAAARQRSYNSATKSRGESIFGRFPDWFNERFDAMRRVYLFSLRWSLDSQIAVVTLATVIVLSGVSSTALSLEGTSAFYRGVLRLSSDCVRAQSGTRVGKD